MTFQNQYIHHIKPLFAFVGALLLSCVISPLFILIIALQHFQGIGIFFIQERPGLHGKLFAVIKFKTMNDSGKITRMGAFLRKTSLDELPQLWNILRGEMTFIGPRPLFKEYLSYYTSKQNHRHDVKPGITGWAQVNGRNLLSLDAKIDLDLFYCENVSFRLDVRIFLLTFAQLFKWRQADYHNLIKQS